MKFSYKILSVILAILIITSAATGCDQLLDCAIGDILGKSQAESEYATSEQTAKGDITDGVEGEETTTAIGEVTSSETDAEIETERICSISILNGSEITLEVGDSVRLTAYKSSFITQNVGWAADSRIVYVDDGGYLTALEVGDVTVTAFAGKATDTILIHVVEKSEDKGDSSDTENHETTAETEQFEIETDNSPLETVPRDEIHEAVNSPSDYKPAGSYEEAIERSQKGELSGYPFVPDQAPIKSEYQPMKDGKYVKNSTSHYIDYNTYVVVDAYGREVFRVYRGGAYITLEEVAAYVYAFGTYPANHSASKNTKPSSSIWGAYLRVNHTKFSGSTTSYPYEPELPRISGCGGDLQYWEMDIGTTGTDCDPSYSPRIYNTGSSISRGAARIVYTWNDLNNNGITDGNDIVFIFYTYNHYNDFQEYLNYYGGWGEMFGNVTGGGTISSKTDYNPTPYVPVVMGRLSDIAAKVAQTESNANYVVYAWIDRRAVEMALCA